MVADKRLRTILDDLVPDAAWAGIAAIGVQRVNDLYREPSLKPAPR
jgi:hypothetical protein